MPRYRLLNFASVECSGEAIDNPSVPVNGPLNTEVNLSALCLGWLEADKSLDALTLEWSRAEMLPAAHNPDRRQKSDSKRLRLLDCQISCLDQAKSDLLERILASPSANPRDAMKKLFIAERLLEGEGGAEHQIVSDALEALARTYGQPFDRSCAG